MVFNDWFDREVDRVERPERPLPSGAISPRHAVILGTSLMLAGLALAALAGPFPLGIAIVLAGLVLFYNSWAKRFFLLGPLVMGCCRFANFLIGMRFAPPRLWWMPATVAGYVVILSLIARHEAHRPAVQVIVKRLLLGIILVDAGLVLSQGDPVGALLVAGLVIPAFALARCFKMT